MNKAERQEKNHSNNEKMPNPKRKGPGGPMGIGGQKPKNFKKSMGRLFGYSKKYTIIIIVAVTLSFIGTILNIISPNIIQTITEEIEFNFLGTINLELIKTNALILITLISLGFIFNYIQGFIMATISQRVSQNLRRDLSLKVNKIPFKYYDTNNIGDTLSKITNDVDTIGQSINQSFGTLVTAITMLIGSTVMMFITNWILALTAIVASVGGFVFMGIIISKTQKYFIKQQAGLGKLNGHIEEIYSGHTIVKAYNAQKKSKETFEKYNDDLYENAWKSQYYSGLMMPLMGFVGNLGYVAVCVVGAVLIFDGQSTFGVLAAFMIYIRLFSNPLSQIAQAISNIQNAAAASERVFGLLDEKELEDESGKIKTLTSIKGNVVFDHVKFGYDENRLIITDFNAKVKAGQKVAIVGPTGAGKTTLVNLLMRFYEVNSGDISIDGVSIKELSRENVHNLFGMVLQDTWVFEGSIFENIAFNNKNVTIDDVKKACSTVGIDFYINTLPQKYDTILTDKISLSAGQKQLITIARAMIQNAPLLIFDEATSSIDTRTESLIQEAMDKLMKGRTSFIIAHRLSTIKNADLILVMDNGDVIEKGTHEELIEQKGFYEKLYNSQFDVV